MIEHVYINNYKAFKKENIPLERNTLLVGTNHSGKTTVLEALDLFFNNVMRYDFIIDKKQPVIIEIQINDNRYRKTYAPPYFKLNFNASIGDMSKIDDYAYLYVPKYINISTLLNDILSVNMTQSLSNDTKRKLSQTADYIDGIKHNVTYSFYSHHTNYQLNIKKPQHMNKHDIIKAIRNVTHNKTIIGIDNFEQNFDLDHIKHLHQDIFQTIVATTSETIIQQTDAFVSQLLTGDKHRDFEVIQKRVNKTQKAYLLVEGKYDVGWFEKGLELLNLDRDYTVLPCGGYGNIQYVKEQLDKENIPSIVVTDGDTLSPSSLKRDIIEMYADTRFINSTFNANLKTMPSSKYQFFKHINEKDDVIKHVLSKWAKNHLTKQNPFVKELKQLIKERNGS
ncbi:MAG: ATP-binding protein [Candidatus Izimaplasma sp.]|nr:ATP-binding protein [Candidatus Izimaplasma bacterium]